MLLSATSLVHASKKFRGWNFRRIGDFHILCLSARILEIHCLLRAFIADLCVECGDHN
jgi:hypothetical protein